MRVEGKVALVTGAAGGIGGASSERLCEEGAHVILSDIDAEGAEKKASQLRAKGYQARGIGLDVAAERDWIAVYEGILAQEGRLDILVNNAGTVVEGSVESLTLERWQFIQNVNLTGVFLGTKHGIPAMRKSDGGGSIVNMCSMKAMVGSSNYAAYDASKGGVRSLTKAAALHCAEQGYGIRVNSVHPGYVNTDLGRSAGWDPEVVEAIIAKMAKLHPIGRLAEPVEIANVVLFLASEESSFMTGSEVVVDGGFIAQ